METSSGPGATSFRCRERSATCAGSFTFRLKRVTPPASAGQADRDALKKAVEQLLSQPPLAGAHVGVEVQSLEDGQTVFSRNAEDLLNPASNTKLITGAAALVRLGPEYRFTTDY